MKFLDLKIKIGKKTYETCTPIINKKDIKNLEIVLLEQLYKMVGKDLVTKNYKQSVVEVKNKEYKSLI